MLQQLQTHDSNFDDKQLRALITELSALYSLTANGNSLEMLSDSVERELATMDKAIEEAANRIEVREP